MHVMWDNKGDTGNMSANKQLERQNRTLWTSGQQVSHTDMSYREEYKKGETASFPNMVIIIMDKWKGILQQTFQVWHRLEYKVKHIRMGKWGGHWIAPFLQQVQQETCVPHDVAMARLPLTFAGRCSGGVPSANSYTGNRLWLQSPRPSDIQSSS